MKCDSTIWYFPLSCLRSPNTVSSPPSSQVVTHGADFLHGDPKVVLGGVGPWGPSCCIPKSQVFPMTPGVFLENPTALAKAGCYLNHLDSNPTEDSSCLSLCQAILAGFNISDFCLGWYSSARQKETSKTSVAVWYSSIWSMTHDKALAKNIQKWFKVIIIIKQ